MRAKVMTDGPIQGMSQATINLEVDAIEKYFDSLGKKMSIDRVETADSQIEAHNLDMDTPGMAVYDLHCTNMFWIWCFEKDMHFEAMTVQINNDAREIMFNTYEDCSADPQVHDIRKTLSHELFHAMGIDHNPSTSSIVFFEYVCGANTGYTASATDKNDLEARYP